MLVVFGGISATAFLNATAAFYVVNHRAARATLYSIITFIVACNRRAYAVFVLCRRAHPGAEQTRELAERGANQTGPAAAPEIHFS
ncbi:MAG: hypothetical protein R2881_09285 [Eubacteriales bacterium]